MGGFSHASGEGGGGGFYMDQSNNSKHDGHLQEWVDKYICLLGNSWWFTHLFVLYYNTFCLSQTI